MTMEERTTDPEDRRQHLAFLQAVVTRMSASSSTTKGWLLPIVLATYGYALTQKSLSVALLGMCAVVLFAIIDANYLNQERSFRDLYDAVARGADVAPFSMNPALAAPSEDKAETESGLKRALLLIRDWFPGWEVWVSWAIAPFYGALLIVGAITALVSL